MNSSTTRKSVIISGGSQGIGASMVEVFSRNGYRVAWFSRQAPICDEGDLLSRPCDVTNYEHLSATMAHFYEAVGPFDVLINNAGIAGDDSKNGGELSFWHKVIDTNLNGAYYVTNLAAERMRRPGGSIINIGSTLSLRGVADQLAYCASKHGLLGLTRAYAAKLAPEGVRVNIICPGFVKTDMAQRRAHEMGVEKAEDLAAGIPSGRLTSPEEVASLALYLASDQARNITGQPFVIDGGVLS